VSGAAGQCQPDDAVAQVGHVAQDVLVVAASAGEGRAGEESGERTTHDCSARRHGCAALEEGTPIELGHGSPLDEW
jgi:hypothetical protein